MLPAGGKTMTLVVIVVLVHFGVAAYLFSRGHKIAAAIVAAAGLIELVVGYNKYR